MCFQVLGIQAVKGGQKRSENKGGMIEERRKHIIPNALSFHLGSVCTKYIQDHPSWLLRGKEVSHNNNPFTD